MIKKLLDSFVPTNYALSLDVDSEALHFTGSVVISGSVTSETSEIILHSKNLDITRAAVNKVAVKSTKQEEFDQLILELVDSANGEVTIELDFNAPITDDMAGMYPSYFEHEGKTQKIIATQFESHHAREVFPCIDEPSAKATFDLTLTSTEGDPVLGNMLPDSQEVKNGKTVTVFETTPLMSTYLLAFAFGPIHCTEATTKDGVLVRSWASLAQPANFLEHSLKEAVALIEFYDDYFGIPYPLAKCDQIALPDFDAGAMENWGLITYRETALLADPVNRSVSGEQYVSLVIAHELSHQWFGNLVTMKWWDDLWLNESFASLVEFIAVDALHPDWSYWEEYTSGDAVAASSRDVFSDVQPVRVDVDDPAQISTLFDGAIVYAKGSRLLKMLREYIGEETFREGLKQYFIDHKYGNTTRDDLWKAFADSSGKDIGKLMNSWLEQSGLPIVSVAQNDTTLTVSQQRLLLDSEAMSKQLWQVPLLSAAKLNPDVFTEQTADIISETNDIVLLNQNASGHYVVRYTSAEQLAHLRHGLQTGEVDAGGRINSLNDILLLSKAGEISLTDGLSVIQTLKQEPRDSVWNMISAILGSARMLVEGNDEADDSIKAFTYQLIQEKYAELGWEFIEDEDLNTTHLRRSILAMAASSENETFITEALSRYNSADPAGMNAEVRSLLMSIAVRFGDDSVIDQLITLHRETSSPDVRIDVCAALTTTKKPEVAQRLVGLFKDKNEVRSQDLLSWYIRLLRNRHTKDVAWQWLKDNWSWVTKTFASSKSYDAFPRYSASCFSTDNWLKEYSDFFKPMQKDLTLERNIKIGIKEISARIDWRKRDQPAIEAWLKENS